MRLGRRVRPVLLLLVFGGFLLIVGTTASGQAFFVSADTRQALLESAVGSDTATVRSFVGLNLTPADLAPGGPTAARREMLRKGLALMVDRGGILHAALLAPDGTVLVSDDGVGEGSLAPLTADLTTSVKNKVVRADLVGSDAAGAIAPLGSPSILTEYVPIMAGGQVYAVAAIWRDAAPILAHLDEARLHVVASTIIAGLISVDRPVLRLPGRPAAADPPGPPAARGRPTRPADRHAEPRRGRGVARGTDRRGPTRRGGHRGRPRRPGQLQPAQRHVRPRRRRPGADRRSPNMLARELPAGATWGRYGPDEFLVISAAGGAADLEPAMERLRGDLADLSLQFESSERLPVTRQRRAVLYPVNGESVTTLLSTAAVTLDDARTSGGDAIRVAEADGARAGRTPDLRHPRRASSSPSTPRTATPAGTPRTSPATPTSSPSASASTRR